LNFGKAKKVLHSLKLLSRRGRNEEFFFVLCLTQKNKIMKLSLDALKERAEAVASEELLSSISGGMLDACHRFPKPPVVTEPD
jgi:hypothetical protein